MRLFGSPGNGSSLLMPPFEFSLEAFDGSSSSSTSSESSWSSESSSSEEFSSESSESSDGLPMPTNISRTVAPTFWLSGAGHLRGATFGVVTKVDERLFRTTNVPRTRYPTALHLSSPYSNSEIRYTLNGRNPTNTSSLYTGPLTFRQNASGTDNTVLKARIYNKTNSNVKSKIIRLEFRVLPVL